MSVRIKSPRLKPADVYKKPFQDVFVAAQVRAAHPTGPVEMRIRAFQSLGPG
jgi:hypothetical protein